VDDAWREKLLALCLIVQAHYIDVLTEDEHIKAQALTIDELIKREITSSVMYISADIIFKFIYDDADTGYRYRHYFDLSIKQLNIDTQFAFFDFLFVKNNISLISICHQLFDLDIQIQQPIVDKTISLQDQDIEFAEQYFMSAKDIVTAFYQAPAFKEHSQQDDDTVVPTARLPQEDSMPDIYYYARGEVLVPPEEISIADILKRDLFQRTALHWAVIKGKVDCNHSA